MSASGWSYFVPYQLDIEQALHKLRRDVFESGEYYSEIMSKEELWQWLDGEFSKPPEQQFGGQDDDGRQEAMIDSYLPIYERLKTMSAPRTVDEKIEELLFLASAFQEGTHSIIDILRVGEAGNFGEVGSLTDDQLIEIYGTNKPTREMLEQIDLLEMLGGDVIYYRGSAFYVIVYLEGQPEEICFIGFSGD